MTVKKKKKEPNGAVSNLNMLLDKGLCKYKHSRIKNVLKALENQLDKSECEKLKELYAQLDTENQDTYFLVDNDSQTHKDFETYVKSLIRKYAKKKK